MALAAMVVAVATARRPWIGIAAVIVLAGVLPAGRSAAMIGLDWHPAIALTVAILVVQAVRAPRSVLADVSRMIWPVVCIGAFIVATVLFSWSSGRMGAYGPVLLQFVAPFLLLFLIRRAVTADRADGQKILAAVLLSASVQAVVILLVTLGLIRQPFEAAVMAARWYNNDAARAIGTLDHPLVTALWIAAGIPVALVFRGAVTRIAVVGVLFVALTQTGARLAIIAGAVGVVVVLARTRMPIIGRLFVASISVLGAVALALGPLGATALARFADDNGSARVRVKTLEFALQLVPETFLRGGGVGANEQITRDQLLKTTFENPLLISMVDFGGLFTILVFGALAALIVGGRRERRVPGAGLAALIVFVGAIGFNSLSSPSTVGFLLFALVALASRTLVPDRTARSDTVAAPRALVAVGGVR